MGCDIHAFVEYTKSEHVFTWTPATGELLLPRDYYVFALLAGVRAPKSGWRSVFPVKGLPADFGFEVDDALHSTLMNRHSESWLSAHEYKDVMGRCSDITVAPEYFATLALMEKYEDLGYRARIVFWFDN